MSSPRIFSFRQILDLTWSERFDPHTQYTFVLYKVLTEHGWIEVSEIVRHKNHIFSRALASGQTITLATAATEIEGFTVDEEWLEKTDTGYKFDDPYKSLVSITFRLNNQDNTEARDYMWVYLDKKQIV